MGVYQRRLKKGVRWQFKKTVRGTSLVSPAIYHTKRAAEEAEARAVAEYLATGKLPNVPPTTPTDSEAPSVLDLLTERIRWVELHRSPAHTSDHKYYFRWVLERRPTWADLPATDITVDMAYEFTEEWAAELVERGLSRTMVNKALTLLQATWNRPWGSRRAKRDFAENPWRYIERHSVERSAKYLPTESQAVAVLVAAGPGYRLLLELYAGTGARPSESLYLQWVDVQIHQEPFSVVLFTAKKRGGSRTPRRVPISPDLAGRLRSWRKQHPETHYVFQRDDTEEPAPRTYTWARKAQIKACAQAGVEFFPLHSWRHWYASRLYRDGVDRARIQALLGHENASTTDRYLHAILGLPAVAVWGK